jgi:hypothetical protein
MEPLMPTTCASCGFPMPRDFWATLRAELRGADPEAEVLTPGMPKTALAVAFEAVGLGDRYKYVCCRTTVLGNIRTGSAQQPEKLESPSG